MGKVVRCTNCKTFQMSNANKTFKCIKCQKTKNITSKRIYFESDNLREVTQVLQKIKEEDFKRKNEIIEGFEDAKLEEENDEYL